jgi:hypothetical protein
MSHGKEVEILKGEKYVDVQGFGYNTHLQCAGNN